MSSVVAHHSSAPPSTARRDARMLAFPIDRDSDVPLHRQVYQRIRDAILSGRLTAGTRLPSTRALATELGVSRNTALGAFEQLTAEGFLEGRIGSGTRVARTLTADLVSRRRGRSHTAPGGATPRLATRCVQLAQITRPLAAGSGRDMAFTPALPAADLFPSDLWARLASHCARRLASHELAAAAPAGHPTLREALATYVAAARGVPCAAEQVVVVAGAQQALDLVARVILEERSTAALENPGYPGARAALVAAGARILPITVDHEGLQVSELLHSDRDARLVYVSPSHQFPLGVTMSAPRRLELLEWAHDAEAWIVEDDYDSEFRYSGPPLTALRGLDRDDRVVYVGTFSKSLFPALRVGFMVLPVALLEPLLTIRTFADLAPPILDQLILTEFLREGHFARHVTRMRRVYRMRRDVLLQALEDECAGLVTATADEMGMRAIAWLPNDLDDRTAARAAAEHGVEVLPISMFYDGPAPRGGLVLNYGATDDDGIRSGTRRLARALSSLRSRAAGTSHRTS